MRGKEVEKYIEQEKDFLKALIDKLENMTASKTAFNEPAEEAQKMEKMAQRRIEEIANGSLEYSSYEYISIVDRMEQNRDESEQSQQPKNVTGVSDYISNFVRPGQTIYIFS